LTGSGVEVDAEGMYCEVVRVCVVWMMLAVLRLFVFEDGMVDDGFVGGSFGVEVLAEAMMEVVENLKCRQRWGVMVCAWILSKGRDVD